MRTTCNISTFTVCYHDAKLYACTQTMHVVNYLTEHTWGHDWWCRSIQNPPPHQCTRHLTEIVLCMVHDFVVVLVHLHCVLYVYLVPKQAHFGRVLWLLCVRYAPLCRQENYLFKHFASSHPYLEPFIPLPTVLIRPTCAPTPYRRKLVGFLCINNVKDILRKVSMIGSGW